MTTGQLMFTALGTRVKLEDQTRRDWTGSDSLAAICRYSDSSDPEHKAPNQKVRQRSKDYLSSCPNAVSAEVGQVLATGAYHAEMPF